MSLKDHEEAMRNPAPGFERGIVGLYKSLAEYAKAHFDRFGTYVSEDYYIGEEWSAVIAHAEALLNGETGRLDCGTLSAKFEDLRTSGGSTDAVQRVQEATTPKAKARVVPVATAPIDTKRLDDRQRDLLSLVRVEGNLAVYTGTERIPDWAALKSVMVALGGKWRAKKGFVFPDDVDAVEAVRLAYETGEIIDPKAAEFFETPVELADALAAWVDAQPGDRILEPSAGRGALVRAVQKWCPEAKVFACEALADHRKELLGLGVELLTEDFMALELGHLFDAVVMNPPFSKRKDVQHIERALSFLKPGGRLAAIASAGVLYRDDRIGQEFRALIEGHGGTIAKNPDGSFRESGTGVATVCVRLEKRGAREAASEGRQVQLFSDVG